MKIRLFHDGADRNSFLMPLNPQEAGLMLQYSIQLVRCEPTTRFNVSGTYCTGNGILHDAYGRFHLDQWTNDEWVDFRNNFVGVIRRYWDGKFSLTPSRAWYVSGGTTTAAKINCDLSIALVDAPAKAQQHYYIIKPRETNFRSFADPQRRLGLFTHQDLALHWNSRPTRVGHNRHRVSYLQSTVLHEFGHTLGLHHVAGEGNNDANYGTTLEQRDDLMGMGDHVTDREARPWIYQLRFHLVPERRDAPLRFTASVVAPQLITYWDDDWQPAAAAAAGGH